MAEKETPIFADGLMWREPRDGAPSFVKGALNVNVEKFYEWAKQYQNEKGWIALDMKESQKLVTYFQLNTWKPKLQKPEFIKQQEETTIEEDLDLPF